MGNWVWSNYIPIPRFHPITMGKTCGIKIKPHVHSSKTNLLRRQIKIICLKEEKAEI